MGLFNKSKLNENYLGLRHQLFNLKPSDIGVTLKSEQQVYAAVNKFPLPEGNKTNVYLLTMNFIYKASFDMSTVDSSSKEISFINFLIQNVINKIRECSDTIKLA